MRSPPHLLPALNRALLLGAVLLSLAHGVEAQVMPDTIPPGTDTIPPVADTIPPVSDTVPPVSDTVPPVSDTILPPDTVPPSPDSLALEGVDPDPLAVQEALGDSLAADTLAADTLTADTLPAVQLPRFPRVVPDGFERGVWSWEREEILGSRANTLAELVAEVPGAVPLRGGDYGAPVSVSFFGGGGGQVRVFRDGIELFPLEGSTPDLARIGLAGLRSVRVVRGLGGVRIELESILAEGGRPYSLIEAGTGDLNTNLFRGTFSAPRALGGVLALAMERVDTRGPRGQEEGSATGGWVRFARGIGTRGVLVFDYSSRASDRGGAGYDPPTASRKAWSLRTRWDLPGGLVGDLFYASTTLGGDEEEGSGFGFEPQARKAAGALLGYESGWIRARGRVQKISGEGLPEMSAYLEASAEKAGVGGVAGEVEWEDWGGDTALGTRLRGWTAPFYGLSLFAEVSKETVGLPFLPEAPPLVPFTAKGDTVPSVVPGPRFTENEGSRFGVSFRRGDLYLSGARVSVSADSLFLLGLPSDREGAEVDELFRPATTLPGGTRTGFELSGRVPLRPTPFALVGSAQWWDQAEGLWTTPKDSLETPTPLSDGELPWRYLPRRSYQAAVSFHDSFYPTGNLEVWFDLGVVGRDPMAVPFMETLEGSDTPGGGAEDDPGSPRLLPTMVPFSQSWFVRLQIRVVTVRVFFVWENFTTRQRNQDFPGRIQPASRSLYGVRWTMWN